MLLSIISLCLLVVTAAADDNGSECEPVNACGVKVLCECAEKGPEFKRCSDELSLGNGMLGTAHDIGLDFSSAVTNEVGHIEDFDARATWNNIQRRKRSDDDADADDANGKLDADVEGCGLRNVEYPGPRHRSAIVSNLPGQMTAILKVIQSSVMVHRGDCHVVTRQCNGDLEVTEHYVFFVQMFPGDIPAALEAIATKYSTDWGIEGKQPCAQYEEFPDQIYCSL